MLTQTCCVKAIEKASEVAMLPTPLMYGLYLQHVQCVTTTLQGIFAILHRYMHDDAQICCPVMLRDLLKSTGGLRVFQHSAFNMRVLQK
jgi:hypothetical protein